MMQELTRRQIKVAHIFQQLQCQYHFCIGCSQILLPDSAPIKITGKKINEEKIVDRECKYSGIDLVLLLINSKMKSESCHLP